MQGSKKCLEDIVEEISQKVYPIERNTESKRKNKENCRNHSER